MRGVVTESSKFVIEMEHFLNEKGYHIEEVVSHPYRKKHVVYIESN